MNTIFMEYIDNSIDSAEEFFIEKTNSYSKEILNGKMLEPYRR